MSRRTDRVGDQVRAALAEILRRDISDPRVALATISHVILSPDLRHAKVMVSVLGADEDARAACIAALQHARGFIRKQLARRLQLRVTPELVFELDTGAEYSQHIAALLEGLKDDDERS